MTGSPATSYPAVWAEAEGPRHSGSVAMGDDGLELADGEQTTARLVRYADVIAVEVVRDPAERLNGYPTLRIDQRRAAPLRISAFGLGIVGELAELLDAAIANKQELPQLLGVVVPLRKGALADAAALIEQGPPFDLEALGIERHDVLLSDREAIFVFEGTRLGATLERLVRDPSAWQTAPHWARLITGPPRLAEPRFGWRSGRRIR